MPDNFDEVFQRPPPPRRPNPFTVGLQAALRLLIFALQAQVAIFIAVVFGLLIFVTYTALRSGSPPPPDVPDRLTLVHSLGVNPLDGTLYAASPRGVFRIETPERALRLSNSYQDSTGFIVVGPDEFLASGRADLRDRLSGFAPDVAGLIRSADAGHNWKTLALADEALFTTLNLVDSVLYGYDELTNTFRVSDDRGFNWEDRSQLAPLLDFVVAPAGAADLIAATQAGSLIVSVDGGRSWQAAAGPALVLLEWPERAQLWGADAGGGVYLSRDDGSVWEMQGAIPGAPGAFLASEAGLFAALTDDRILFSADGGLIWEPVYENPSLERAPD